MALTVTVNLTATDGTFALPPFSSGRIALTQATDGGGNPGVISVGTTEETVTFDSVTPGLVLMYNLDATNYVEWGVATGVYPFRLRPKLTAVNYGVPNLVYINSGTLYLKANTAACRVLILGYNA
jgi:hypothetical protein